MSDWMHYRAKVAALSRDRAPDDPELLDARQKLREERLKEHIEKTVAEWGPVPPERLDRLNILLRGEDVAPSERLDHSAQVRRAQKGATAT